MGVMRGEGDFPPRKLLWLEGGRGGGQENWTDCVTSLCIMCVHLKIHFIKG